MADSTPEAKPPSPVEAPQSSTPQAQPPAPWRRSRPAPRRRSRPERPITIDDFMKVELRVAKVLPAERVPKSSRLLKLLVDVGSEQRTIVAGIAESYEPEALVGRTVVDRLQPEAGEADGRRIERDGAGRKPRGRQGDARQLRRTARARNARAVSGQPAMRTFIIAIGLVAAVGMRAGRRAGASHLDADECHRRTVREARARHGPARSGLCGRVLRAARVEGRGRSGKRPLTDIDADAARLIEELGKIVVPANAPEQGDRETELSNLRHIYLRRQLEALRVAGPHVVGDEALLRRGVAGALRRRGADASRVLLPGHARRARAAPAGQGSARRSRTKPIESSS